MKALIKQLIPSAIIRYRCHASSNKVALSFDDGPKPGTTDKILDTLSEHGMKATFFVLGHMVEDNPELCRNIVEQGHEIGNHGYSHTMCPDLSLQEIRNEINKTDNIVKKITNVAPQYYRPPNGALCASLMMHMMIERQQSITLWSQLIENEARKDRAKLVEEFTGLNLKAGDIILLHDVNTETCAALPDFLQSIKERQLVGSTISATLQ